MKARYDMLWIGLLTGFLMPVLTFFVFFLAVREEQSLSQFFAEVLSRNVFTQVISLCAVPNLLLFFLFIWLNWLYSARGALMATIILALLVLGYKWLVA